MKKGFIYGIAFGAVTTAMLMQNDDVKSMIKKYQK